GLFTTEHTEDTEGRHQRMVDREDKAIGCVLLDPRSSILDPRCLPSVSSVVKSLRGPSGGVDFLLGRDYQPAHSVAEGDDCNGGPGAPALSRGARRGGELLSGKGTSYGQEARGWPDRPGVGRDRPDRLWRVLPQYPQHLQP